MGNGKNAVAHTVRLLIAVSLLAATLSNAGAAVAAEGDVYRLVFPVAGDSGWGDTWGAPRSEGRTHKGTDIFAARGTPVVASAAGTVARISVGDRAGRYIVVEHDDGWTSYYMHLNNDSPGTDDGAGGAPAPGIVVGVRVEAGDVLDYVGDSGNAEGTSPHLHFELHRPDGTAVNPAPHLKFAETGEIDSPALATTPLAVSYQADGTEFVGQLDPGGGFAAGLAVHDQVAYMGTWGRGDLCPNSGVRVIDISDPTSPTLAATLASGEAFPGTSTDGVWAGAVDTDWFSGDLAVVAVRLCDTSERNRGSDAFRGLALYDVTNPQEPVLVGTLHSGELTQGVNDVTTAVRPDGTVVVSATVMQSYLHTGGAVGDWRLIDISDPTAPVQVSDWDFRATLPDGAPESRSVALHAHTTTLGSDGSTAWIGVWDAGIVMLDLSAPDQPTMAARVPIGEGEEGNAHSVAFDPESGLLIRNDEDLAWDGGERGVADWGLQTLYDASDLANIVPVATYATANADLSGGVPKQPGYFSAHEIVLVDNLEYLSWYSDGLRVVDISDPVAPVEIASFVPAPSADPQRHFLGYGRGSDFAMVWSVKLADGLIYLSDMNSGLWIVRLGASDETSAVVAE